MLSFVRGCENSPNLSNDPQIAVKMMETFGFEVGQGKEKI